MTEAPRISELMASYWPSQLVLIKSLQVEAPCGDLNGSGWMPPAYIRRIPQKSAQVLLMRDVYRKAFVVSVCLQTLPTPEGVFPQVYELSELFLASVSWCFSIYINTRAKGRSV